MKPILIANWKANFTNRQVQEWLGQAQTHLEPVKNATIILCPPHTALTLVHELITDSTLHLGAQNVSSFPHGKYTGEVTVEMLSGIVRYCLVGHSERRKYFSETSDLIARKIALLEAYKIKPVVCVENVTQAEELSDLVKTRELIVSYEPTFAIGTGTADTPDNAFRVAEGIKKYFGQAVPILYGGSVTAQNVSTFLKEAVVEGVLVGGESLDPHRFVQLVAAANSAN